MSIIINLFGTGLRCWLCEIPDFRYEQLQTVASFTNSRLDELIFDLDRLNKIGYAHWKNIYPIQEINGFVLHPLNTIEIKNGGKKIDKFRSIDLANSSSSLFKIYNTLKISFKLKKKNKYQYLLIGQKEVGNYKYSIKQEKLDVDALSFGIHKEIKNENLLVYISYQNKKLRPTKEDTLIREVFINYVEFENDIISFKEIK